MAKDLNNASLLPLGHKERTARRHIKEVIDDDIYDKSQRVWAKHVWDETNYRFKWVELSDEELAFYRKGFKIEDISDLDADYQAGLITYKEYNESRFEAYKVAKEEADIRFNAAYGFVPQRKYKIKKGAF